MKGYLLLLLIFCLGVSSCSTRQSGDNGCGEVMSLHDSLILDARFSECGEWGGHKEQMVIPNWRTDSASLIYMVYPYHCDSLDYYYSNNAVSPATAKVIVLLDTLAKEAITQYIQRLIISKSKERFPGHAGNIFSVQNSGRTLKIKVHDQAAEPVKSFRQLVSALFNDSTKALR